MSSGSRLRAAIASNAALPTVWPVAVIVLLSVGCGAGVAAALGYADVALSAGFVAALATVGGVLVPPALTTQVALPAGVAVALAPPLALAGEGRPVVAALVAAVVFAVTALAQQDEPTGRLVGALGGTAYVLAVGLGLVRDAPLSHTFVAGAVGLGTAAALIVGVAALRARREEPGDAPDRLPGRFATRLGAAIATALRERQHNQWARLAVRRVVVLVPMVAVLEAWRDPVALYALVVAFSVTQPVASDTVDRALARVAGVVAAVLVTGAVGLVAPDWAVIAFGVVAMVAGLAYLLRSPFLTTLGTTVLTVAGSVVSGSSSAVTGRLVSTLAGAAVGLLASVLIRGAPPPPSG
ncbi:MULTISPECIES: FUSC family protein [unclassified Nocardioides]|uniref:FUSC family protein n=1 Tax=unclassified Nocardioides TaxID=2615069 RepID=UPI003619B6FD